MSDSVDLAALREHGFEPVPAIVWDEPDVLRPGIDYKDGTTFVTVPARTNVVKTVGRGKAAREEVELVNGIAVISSEGTAIPYTRESILALGYDYPDNVTREAKRRWSRESITEFLAGKSIPPDPANLHTALRSVYEEYVEFAADAYYDILPLFIMATYMFRHFRAVGYLHFNGTASTGKSQNLNILNSLAFNSTWASSMSSAALYRQLAGNPGTALIDEAEGFEGERGEELRRILNAGYLDGATVKRAEKGANDTFQVVSFESFGPKAIASINPLDPVIGSRCLIVAMRPAIRTMPGFDQDDPRWQRLRDRLYLWVMFHSEAIAALVAEWQRTLHAERAPKLISRQWQITQMYVILADYIDRHDGGDRCDRLIEFFNDYFTKLQKQQDATDRIRIVLKVLPRVLAEQDPVEDHWYRIKHIHEAVLDRLEADQAEYFRTSTLGKNLNTLGFRERRNAKGGGQVWLDPAVIRQEFLQRRVEPYPEDVAWLTEGTEYVHHPPTAAAAPQTVDLWADLADEEPE